jgi:hypothetical protein
MYFLYYFSYQFLFKYCSYLVILNHFRIRISDKWLLIYYDYLHLDQHRQVTEYFSLEVGPFRPYSPSRRWFSAMVYDFLSVAEIVDTICCLIVRVLSSLEGTGQI